MTKPNPERARDMLLGALVADAASMGFHWLYDQDRIASLAGDTPEFRTPDPADYADTKGFFAHGGKPAGALSHYGEQCLVMYRALALKNGYDRAIYEQEFQNAFGYGGTYTGYIDRPTRATLDTMAANPDATGYHGADDMQLPATSKLPGIAVAAPDMVEDAIRVTNNNDTAVDYGRYVADIMAQTLAGISPSQAVKTGGPAAIKRALGMDGTTIEITNTIGMSCQLDYGVPSVAHNMLHSIDFKTAVRTNILAGGDSCGRAIIVGALMGAEHGVPDDWAAKLVDLPEIESLIQAIV